MLPKMMIFNSDVLGPRSKFWILGHCNTGLIDTRDCSNEGYAKVIAYGIESYHAITIHSLEEETFRVITIEDRKIPRDKTKAITEECVYIPEYAMEDFDNLLVFCVFYSKLSTMAATGAIRRRHSPDGGIQWLRVKPWMCSIG